MNKNTQIYNNHLSTQKVKQHNLFQNRTDDLLKSQKIPDSAQTTLTRRGTSYIYIKDKDQAKKAILKILGGKTTFGIDTETAKLPDYKYNKDEVVL